MQPRSTHQPNSSPDTVALNVYALRTKIDLVLYLHLACWSPVLSTWCAAIDQGFLSTFPALTSTLVRKYLPKSVATTKGHMKRVQKNLRTTNPSHQATEEHIMTASSSTRTYARTNLVTFHTFDPKHQPGAVATDQTGRFPVRSSKGNQYIMVAYVRDANAILAIPIKNRSETTLVAAYSTLYEDLTNKGLQPLIQICDNECPRALKKFLLHKQINLQLVPPYDHRTNPAEKAIDTFKSHFIAGLSSLPPTFPLHLWDRLIDHATLTLNLLRPSRLNPRLSAHAQMNGAFDYNSTPLAPPGCRVVIHESPERRATWNSKGIDGYYIGPALQHYRCHKVYIPSTRSERIAKTVDFFPHNCARPFASPQDNATRAADALAHALKGAQSSAPYQLPGDDQLKAIVQLSHIFSQLVNKQSTTPTHPAKARVSPPRVHVSPPRVPNSPVPSYNPHHNGPHLIEPDVDIPDTPTPPRYNLRSRYSVAAAVLNKKTGALEGFPALIKGDDKEIWHRSYANDLGRLAQGIGNRVEGTNTVFFIPKSAVPKHKRVTYGKKECTLCPNKAEVYRTRLTVGGDKLIYHGDTATQCASLTTAKLILNSTISTPGARFGCIDIKNMYYGTPMSDFEYMKIKYDEIPQEVITEYNLDKIVGPDGYIYLEIRKGMPGLKQAGKIANDRLTTHLAKYGYHPCKHTPALWRHVTRKVTFALVVDDFGVKYEGRENFKHLCDALRDLYEITVDEKGEKFLGLSIKWNYLAGWVEISMPGYVKKALLRFQHIAKTRRQNAPHSWNKPVYGKKIQLAATDESPSAPATAATHVQQVVGTFLYYGLGIDLTMLVTLGTLASQQTCPTEATMSEVTWFLDYCASNPDAVIRYERSEMVLWTVTDASYLSEPRARSRAGALFFLSDLPKDPKNPKSTSPKQNGIIYAMAKIIPNVMSSAMESEVAGTFMAAKEACPIRVALEEMGHPQPPTPMQADNSTAVGFANNKIKPKRSKAIDMRFHWVRDRVAQGQFVVYWSPGKDNLADYVTKHHPPSHHVNMRPKFFRLKHYANIVVSYLLQGCDSSPVSHVRKYVRSTPAQLNYPAVTRLNPPFAHANNTTVKQDSNPYDRSYNLPVTMPNQIKSLIN